jgi:thiamine biosynthesis protein ThiS
VIRLRINGRDVELAGPTPLGQYLASLGVDPRAVAVELNERILERSEIAATRLDAGDVVEIVRMVGGGSAQTIRHTRPEIDAPKGEGR